MQQNRRQFSVTPLACISISLLILLVPLDWVVAWIAAVVVHECGHLFVCKLFRSKIHSIQFRLLGAVIITESLPIWQQILCAFAGPGTGLLLIFTRKLFPQLAICACVQSVYNLLPLKHLDGGRILRGILLLCTTEHRVDIICACVDRVIRIVILILGLFLAWKLSWFALAVFIVIMSVRRTIRKTPCKQVFQRVQYQ